MKLAWIFTAFQKNKLLYPSLRIHIIGLTFSAFLKASTITIMQIVSIINLKHSSQILLNHIRHTIFLNTHRRHQRYQINNLIDS